MDAQHDDQPWPQAGRERQVLPQPIAFIGTGIANPEAEMLARLNPGTVMMMGDNPALPRMPKKPQLLDFYRLRFQDITTRHLLQSASLALNADLPEKVVMACLLHDISNGALIRADHGYWGAQMIGPYVDEEIAWAVKYHTPLRYFADESVGYQYPEGYNRFFGPDYEIPEYVRRDAEYARNHRWYMTSRLVTMNDLYSFDPTVAIDPEIFTDIIGRHFRTPEEGLGFDSSPAAHMWRTMIWPNNFL